MQTQTRNCRQFVVFFLLLLSVLFRYFQKKQKQKTEWETTIHSLVRESDRIPHSIFKIFVRPTMACTCDARHCVFALLPR